MGYHNECDHFDGIFLLPFACDEGGFARPFQITEYNPFDRLDPSQILNAVFHNGVANSACGTIPCSVKEALVQLFATRIVQPTLRLGEVLLTRLPSEASPSLSSSSNCALLSHFE